MRPAEFVKEALEREGIHVTGERAGFLGAPGGLYPVLFQFIALFMLSMRSPMNP